MFDTHYRIVLDVPVVEGERNFTITHRNLT